ncbi:hypothetical protein [Frankia sp. AgB32]|uniref:hypothetical protein n=1 Tax=Frankia sp. AgB32 TaxID=631119 RepID=UPI00200E3091|nr:hypothetical protein [Frankia sp. AgB32]MCK9897302.1 hypothetical protein [Frankia sp. AgB32]
MTAVIYPPRRALESAAAIPGVRPLRLFAMLWPLWQVEISADVHDPQSYEVLDRFLIRAVAEGRLATVGELAGFFSLPVPLVRRCLDFLATIGHVTLAGPAPDPAGDARVALTPLGEQSWRAGVRYVEKKEARQTLMFERFTGWPLPRAYYDGRIAVLPSPEVPADRAPGPTRFRHLYTHVPLRPGALEALAARPDRAEFNVPAALGQIRALGTREGWLPCYLVETAGQGLLAYTAGASEPDPFLAQVCQEAEAARMRIDAEDAGDPREIWTAWLSRFTHGAGLVRQTSTGMWRIVLPATSFGDGGLKLYRLGSFELSRNHIAQLWCTDDATRRAAARDRALAMTRRRDVTTLDGLLRLAEPIARTLDVPLPTPSDLRDHARATRRPDLLGRLDQLGRD